MSFSGSMSGTAAKLINKYGESVVMINRYNCVYDPSLGEEVCTEDRYARTGKVGGYTISEQSADNINTDDLRLIIQTEVKITKDWKVEYKEKEYSIITIAQTVAQNMTIVQTVQLRAASTL